MSGKKLSLMVFILVFVVAPSAYAGPAVEVGGELNLSGTGTISFPDGSKQTTAATDCNGRYENNADGTVTDCRTGLTWLKDANCVANIGGINKTGALTWDNAKTWIAALGNGVCGLSDGSAAGDWRLPTKTEWMAMVAAAKRHNTLPDVTPYNPVLTNGLGTGQWVEGDVFSHVQSSGYWSSTTSSFDAGFAWSMVMTTGDVFNFLKLNPYYVWPVRAAP